MILRVLGDSAWLSLLFQIFSPFQNRSSPGEGIWSHDRFATQQTRMRAVCTFSFPLESKRTLPARAFQKTRQSPCFLTNRLGEHYTSLDNFKHHVRLDKQKIRNIYQSPTLSDVQQPTKQVISVLLIPFLNMSLSRCRQCQEMQQADLRSCQATREESGSNTCHTSSEERHRWQHL